ncbi:alpha/beta fold hydrolase [Bacillus sp. T33-2]|uniref:alpha/beta fold hydrolase n=1 Tax=Bacillus sp. T33-2 TaxID=2054168 RepID=UPI000C78C8E8|nr:alpha/beta hydrolase [Bacillus sp. T33-2]PLR96957.1 alpha/beta hydrolase [Bacillus sp. T33-2]
MECKKTATESFIELDGGYKLFTKTIGQSNGNPTVVMEAGYGDFSNAWDKIIPEIAKLTKVFVYDRAGLGTSEKSPNPRTSKEMVKELNELLTKACLKPPYILVGHSFGGLNVRLYTSEFPIEVAGVILVDSTPEDYKERFLPTMSAEFQEAYNKQFVHEGTYEEFMESLNQIKQSQRHLGSVPVIVLSAGKKAHYSPKSQALWHELQKEILNISDDSELIIAHNSAHYIQHDEPEIVISAIKRLLQK